jgi:hypothetical protein
MDNLIVSGGDIVDRECGVAVYHYLRKFNLFEELRSAPAFSLYFARVK